MPRKILLIEPPFYRLFKDTYTLDRYPLSLGYLSGTIKKRTNWDVASYNVDFNLNRDEIEPIKLCYLTRGGFNNYLYNLKDVSRPIWQELKSTILKYNPDVVGISANSQNFTSASIVAKLTKAINANINVVVGGPHTAMAGADVLRCSDIDICVKGEGEETIVELLNVIGAQKELGAVKGIIYRENGRIIEAPSRELIEDLDSLCFPHENASETLKDYGRYPATAFSSIFATRGCPYNCFFCGTHKIWGRKVRFRSPDNVIREIKCLQDKGVPSIHFDDDTFGVNKQYLNELCNSIIVHCPGLKWSCEIHVKLVDDETISLMRKAGCYLIQLGIESGNNEILKKIRKNITVEEALLACKIIKKHGITLHTFFVLGFPWETEATIQDTAAVMRKSKSDALIYSIFTPYPGTEAFEFCRNNGLINDEYNLALYHHQSPVNYFCPEITPERFRMLAARVERMVDNFNKSQRIIKLFSLYKFKKIRELGVRKSLRRAIRVLSGK